MPSMISVDCNCKIRCCSGKYRYICATQLAPSINMLPKMFVLLWFIECMWLFGRFIFIYIFSPVRVALYRSLLLFLLTPVQMIYHYFNTSTWSREVYHLSTVENCFSRNFPNWSKKCIYEYVVIEREEWIIFHCSDCNWLQRMLGGWRLIMHDVSRTT